MRLLTLVFFFTSLRFIAQPLYFEKVYGSASDDYSRSVKQLASGSIYVLGNSASGSFGAQDISLTKLNRNGMVIWTQYYGTINPDNAYFLNLTNDGNLVMVAETESAPNNLDVLIYKLDTLGGVIWDKSFVSPVNETAKYIEQTIDGGYILCGAQNDLVGYNDILVVKIDSNGNYTWHQTYGRNDNEYADMIHQDGTGYILTGDTKSYGAGGYDVMIFSLDSTGVENWSQTYGDSLENGCQGLLQLNDGNYLSYGETEIYPHSPFDFYLEKVDRSGSSIWRYTYGGAGADALFSVKEDNDGGFICTGYTNSYNGLGPLDLVILKVDSAGAFDWKQTYGGAGIDIGFEIIKANDVPGFIITGKTFNVSEEYYLLKLDPEGTLIGINESYSERSLQIFPNPAKEEIFINWGGEEEVLLIYDIFGVLRKRTVLKKQDYKSMSVSDLTSGTYFLRTEQSVACKKLIVIK